MQITQLNEYIKAVINDVDGYGINVLYYHLRKTFLENEFSLKETNYIEISDKYLQVPMQVNLHFDYSSPERCIALLMSLRAIILNPSFFKNCENDDLFFKPFCQEYFSWIKYCSVIVNNENDADFFNLFCMLEDFEYDDKISKTHLVRFEKDTIQPVCRNLGIHYRKIAERQSQNTKDVIIDNAYLNDDSLSEYVIPEEIEYVGNTAFSYCKNLTRITFLRKDTLFGKFPIIECPLLKYIIVPEGSEEYYKEQLAFYKRIIFPSGQVAQSKKMPQEYTLSIEKSKEVSELQSPFISTGQQSIASEEQIAAQNDTTEEIDIKKISELFKHKSTTYKYFWFMSILDIIKEKSELVINYQELIVKMIALAWPFAQERIGFGPMDNIPNIIQSLILTKTIQLHNNEKVVEKTISEKYNNKTISKILSALSKNVPYRFLSPWIKYSTDKEVMIISQSPECASPYALYEDYILLDESWYDYFNEHYKELYNMTKSELMNYLKKYNDGLKLLKFMID